ncbi:hypothetical protein ACFVAE_07105 [Microbacterium sp. NPDC057659]|uniref:hypothetical protein n=1 Tax=Microbacterium sp. NPDC057659 TaxID=3346198 RepID=UPI0036702071
MPDVLRGVAILAMLIAHAALFLPNMPWAVDFVRGNINDVASPLFALVMGMSAQLVWNRRAGVGRTILQQSVRGVILVVLGLWMMTWGSWVAIILQPLGLLLIVGVPLLLCGSRVLTTLLVVLAVLSQPVLTLARDYAAIIYGQGPVVRALAEWTVLGTHYRLLNLLLFFLLGALLLRAGLHRGRMLWVMAIVAVPAYLAKPIGERLGAGPVQSGDYLDTLHDLGLVCVVYVIVILAATAARGSAQRFWAAVFVPFCAWGQVALSMYLLHVAIIAGWMRLYGLPDRNILIGWMLVVPLVCLIGWAWWRFVGPGPVEWLMGLVIGRRRRWRPEGRVPAQV